MKLKDLLAIMPAKQILVLAHKKPDNRFFDDTARKVDKRLYDKEVLKITHGEMADDILVILNAPDEILFSQMEWDEDREVYVMPIMAAKAV